MLAVHVGGALSPPGGRGRGKGLRIEGEEEQVETDKGETLFHPFGKELKMVRKRYWYWKRGRTWISVLW